MTGLRTLYLCGAGNPEGVRLALAVNRMEGRWDELVLLDDDPAKHGRSVLGVRVAGPFEALRGAARGGAEAVNMVARTTRKRAAARSRIAGFGHPFASLVDPRVDIAGAELGAELTVYEDSTVCPGVALGDATVVFMRAIAGHGSRVGRGCVIGPGAVLNARVELGDGVYVGSNATILPEIKVGSWATVGAGSVVVQDVPEGATVFGVPAQVLAAAACEEGPGAGGPVDAEVERQVSRIWQETLGVADAGAEVNFFDLGGDSLAALRVCARVREGLYADLAVTDIFRFPTVRSLARHLTASLSLEAGGSAGAGRAAAIRRQLHHRSGQGRG
ncbi:MAG: hypothetical protein HY721_10365 [Planctomycetes bacterium]|nr:hypothetical protein [Planctomycetota bacterium]